jgi:DNA primase
MNTAWVDFESIKRAVSLEMVLNHYRFELRSVGAGTVRGKCPLPMHGSKESRASFTATLTKGVGGVWACQSVSCIKARGGKRGGNALDFVAIMEGCTLRDAAAKMAEWFAIPSHAAKTYRTQSQSQPPEDSNEHIERETVANKPLTFTLQGIEAQHPYLKSRGVDEATARTFGIGYFSGRGSMQKRIVIPIHNERGELVAYAGRSIDANEPRYKFPAGFHKGSELYNLHRAVEGDGRKRRVVVVEGFFDCLAVSRAGFPCVAIMGSSLSKAQEELLVRYFKGVCLFLDGDEAGRRATEDILVRLGYRLWVHAVALPAGAQPDGVSEEEIRNALW